MAEDNKEVVIKISAKNLTKAEFDAARKQLSGLADETEKAAKKTKAAKEETNVFAESWKKLTASFAAADLIAGAVRGLVDFGLNALKAAGDLTDLSDKTGLSLDFLQRLGFVAKMSGSDIDKYTDTIYKMGLNVAKGGDETRRAVEKMGLSWEQFRRLSPEDQFLALADNINFTSDVQERNATLTAIAGKGISEVIVGLVSDYRGLAAETIVTSDAALRALDQQQDAWDRFVARSTESGRAFLANFALGAEVVGKLPMALAASLSGAASIGEFYDAYGSALKTVRERAAELTETERRMVVSLLENGHAVKDVSTWTKVNAEVVGYLQGTLKSTTTTQRDWADELRKAEGSVASLTASQRAEIETAKRAGATTDQLTEQYGLSAVALKLLEEQTKEDTRARDAAAKKTQEFREAQERVRLATADINAETYKSIAALAAKGVAEKDIITLLGQNEVTVKRVIASEKERTDISKKAAEQEAKLNQERAADFKKTQDDIAKWLAEGAAKRDALTVATLAASLDAEERMRAAASGSHALQMAELRQAEAAEIRSAREKYDVNSANYQKIESEIRARYQHERDYANATQSTIVERMRDQGVITRAEQQAIVAAFERDYQQMVASGEYSYDQLEEAERRWREASRQLSAAAVLRFVNEMQQVLQVGDAVFGLIGGLGNDTAAKIGAVGTRIVSVAQQGSEAMAAFATGQWVQGAIKSIGAISTALQGLFSGNETKKAREEFASSMGLSLDGLYKKLQSMGAEGQRLANQALNVIGKHDEAGNRRWMEEVKAFMAGQEAQAQRLAEAYKDAQDNIGGALGNVTKHIAANAAEHVRLQDGLQKSKERYEQLANTGNASQEDLAAAARDVAKWQGDLNKSVVTSQGEFDRLSRIALNTFNTLVKSGVDPVTAMQRVGGSVDAIIQSVSVFGLKGNAAYDALSRWRNLTTVNAPLIESIGGLNELMQMTNTLGGLTEDAYRDLAAQGVSSYQQLISAGFKETEALTIMKPSLERIVALEKEKGYAIDDATQNLIDQAREQGVLGDQQLSTNDVLMEGFAALIQAVGGDVPEAFKKMSSKADEEARRMERSIKEAAIEANREARDAFRGIGDAASEYLGDRTFKIGVDVDWPELPEGYGGGSFEWPELRPQGFANGGVAHGPLLAAIEPGRREIIGDVPFMERALMGAIDKMGIRTPGSPASALAGNGGGQPIALNVYVDGQLRHAEVIEVVNRGLQGQQIQVPLSATSGRIRP